MNQIVVAHGGVGSPISFKDGTENAVVTAYNIIKFLGSSIDAVETAIIILEDDERFNAGTGSYMRLNKKIEMDASIMDSDLKCGAVANIRNVKNPIKVARLVMDTPHILLVGEGAIEFARKNGFEYFNPITEKARKKFKEVKEKLKNNNLESWQSSWKKFKMKETVGSVAFDGKKFASATSTGGVSIALNGRVGDSPIIGAGIYAGKNGAVSCTGIGEEIIKRVLAFAVYNKIEELGVQKACEYGVSLFENHIPIGIIAVSKDEYGVASSQEMACSVNFNGVVKSFCKIRGKNF